jgi:hypothetical protein
MKFITILLLASTTIIAVPLTTQPIDNTISSIDVPHDFHPNCPQGSEHCGELKIIMLIIALADEDFYHTADEWSGHIAKQEGVVTGAGVSPNS